LDFFRLKTVSPKKNGVWNTVAQAVRRFFEVFSNSKFLLNQLKRVSTDNNTPPRPLTNRGKWGTSSTFFFRTWKETLDLHLLPNLGLKYFIITAPPFDKRQVRDWPVTRCV
jgi:hypothetical protein